MFLVICVIFQKAVYMADKDSGNLQTVSKNEDVTVALWANLAKNAKYFFCIFFLFFLALIFQKNSFTSFPRIRSFMFENEGVGFEIPRTMATSDISIRFVLTKYDFHSYQATSYPPVRRKVKLPELPELPAESGESVTDRQTSLVEDGNEEPNPEDPVMALLGGSVCISASGLSTSNQILYHAVGNETPSTANKNETKFDRQIISN